MNWLRTALLSAFVLFGCHGKDELNRAQVATDIQAASSFNRPKQELISSTFRLCADWRREDQNLVLLEKAGFVRVVENHPVRSSFQNPECTVEPLGPAADAFKLVPIAQYEPENVEIKGYEVVTYEVKFGAVTGIHHEQATGSAEAEFTYSRAVNVFGKALNTPECHACQGRAYYKRFDDGWRLTKIGMEQPDRDYTPGEDERFQRILGHGK